MHPITRRGFGLRRNLMRPDDSERADRVTYIELFFDLVFVFALTQLSNHLFANQTPLGVLESVILVLAIWWAWVYTTWVTNWLDPARLPVRVAVIALSLVGFVMSVALYEAFGDRGAVFAAAYVVLQLGRTVFMIVAVARHDASLGRDFVHVLVWLAAAGVFWIVGAVVSLEYRLLLWAVAIAIEYLSAAVGFRVPGMRAARVGDWDISGPHIAERSAQFVIIAIGESLLVTGFAFVDQEASVAGALGVLLAFVSGVTMWWLYFDRGERAGVEAIEAAERPGRLARVAYTYVHIVIIGGIVLNSVADKEILKHPDDPIELSAIFAIVGAPLLYVGGLAMFRWVVSRDVPVSHLLGVALLAVSLVLAMVLPASVVTALGLGAVTTGVLVVVAAWDTMARLGLGLRRRSTATAGEPG